MAWTDLIGQPLALRVLQAHLRRQRVAPAYLFVGPEGVGKRRTAFEMAKALNCERRPEGPCDQCDQCRRILRQVHPDLHTLAPQGVSEAIRIDEVRGVLGRIALRPYMGICPVVVLDGADRLTDEAGNLLLKVLEEPPGQTRFFLLTAKPFHCLPTILSRCQMIRFQRLSVEVLEERLITMHRCHPPVAQAVSPLAQGSLSRAIELATQWDAYRTMLTQLGSGRPPQWLEWIFPTDRKALSWWLTASVGWLRDVAVASVADESLIHHRDAMTPIRHQAQWLNRESCVETAMQCIELWESLEQFVNPRLIGALLREGWLALLGETKDV